MTHTIRRLVRIAAAVTVVTERHSLVNLTWPVTRMSAWRA